jgi:predicted phosphate transport protein (TIGR00153 family)
MPPKTSLFNLFGPSPIRPLQKHMSTAHKCALALLPFFDAVLSDDWENAQQLQQQIAELEREADHLKKDLRLHLPKNLFLPVPRSDLLEMLTLQDRIANRAKDIAGLVIGRKMRIPTAIAGTFRQLLERCLEASNQALQAIDELDELLETGFRGNEVKVVEAMIVELDKIEHDTDKIQVTILQTLFQLESTLPPIDVVFLYKVIEWTGDLADYAHSVGGQLQLLLAR